MLFYGKMSISYVLWAILILKDHLKKLESIVVIYYYITIKPCARAKSSWLNALGHHFRLV